jgi:hypothetical protein
MKTVQRLNTYQSLSVYDYDLKNKNSVDDIETNSGWYIESGPATIVFSGDNYFASNFFNIKISPTGSEDIILRLDFDEPNSPFVIDDVGQNFIFTCVLQCTKGSPVVEASLQNLNSVPIAGNSRKMIGGSWDAVRSNMMTLTSLDYEEDLYGIKLTISNHSPNFVPGYPETISTIYISTPNLVNDSAWANNPVIQNMRPYIPGFYESYDSKETDPTWPFFRLVDVLTDAIADTMFIYSEWFEYYNSELPAGFSKSDIGTRSRLTNYLHVKNEYAPWLSQFSGNQIVNQLYTSSGSEIITDTDSYKTWQLYPAGYGRGSGTQSAIKSAAEFALTDTKTTSLSQRYDAGSGENPWNILITTLGSETPDVDFRGSVRLATTENITIASALNAGDTIDGVTLVNGDKVLVKNQATPSQNGVYVVSASPSRYPDFDTGWNGTSGEIKHGSVWSVTEGTTNGDKSFTTTIAGGGNVTVDSTAIDFIAFAGSEVVLSVVEKARPMGYKIYHNVVEEFNLTLGSSAFGVLGAAVL